MSNSNNTLTSKRFVLRQSLIGKNAIITVNFKNGKTVTYSHDKAFTLMQSARLFSHKEWRQEVSQTCGTRYFVAVAQA